MLEPDACESPDGYLEVPSCIESLANSAGQLRQLAHQTGQFYIKTLLCYGYTSNPNEASDILSAKNESSNTSSRKQQATFLSGQQRLKSGSGGDVQKLLHDQNLLKSCDSIVRLLPFLFELSTFVERCLVTIELTIKRITYHLNSASLRTEQSSVKSDTLQLTSDVHLDAVFVALMDLLFALVSLDKTLDDHTDIKQKLKLLHQLLQQLVNNQDESEIWDSLGDTRDELPKKKLLQLNNLIESTGMAVGASFVRTNANIFLQCIERVQNFRLVFDKDKTQAGFRLFHRIFADFLVFYSEYLIDLSAQNIDCSSNNPKITKTVASIFISTNLIPTTYMTTQSRKLLGLSCLSLMFCSIFQAMADNKKVHRAINLVISRTKPSNIVLLEGSNSHLLLDEFLLLYMPKSSIDSRSFDLLANQMDLLQKTDALLEYERLLQTLNPWLIKLKSEALDYEQMQMVDWPKRQILVLDQGLRLANEISVFVKSIPIAFERAELVIDRASLIGFYKLTILLKSIRTNMEKCELLISSILLKIEHFIRVQWRQLFYRLQKRQISTKYVDRKMDLSLTLKLSALIAKSELLSTNQGRIIQSICLSMLLPLLNQAELQDLNLLLDLMRWQSLERLSTFTDCSHLYWHIATLDSFYNHVFEELNGATSDIHLLHQALNDVENLFAVANRPSWSQIDLDWLSLERQKLLQNLSSEVLDRFKEGYLDRVCQELEVDLRLQTHQDLYSNGHAHDDVSSRGLYDFKQILSREHGQSTNFYLLNQRINLHHYVENYLNKVCYELTALAPHDWFSYDNMMNHARHKYGFRFVDTQLPVQSLESGLDLLDITRNLGLFASRYSYDLTRQIFIEKCNSRTSVTSSIQSITSSFAPSGSNQMLNTIQSHHIAQSVRTHGFGLLGSAVNCTYQTLKRLINIFSRQLADEKLRAVLRKEYQQMVVQSGSPQKADWTFAFKKAQRMAKRFRLNISAITNPEKNDVRSPAQFDLDSFRQTITQIGNLLAFVRLIKNGALTSASKSIEYIYDFDEVSSFKFAKCLENEFTDYPTHKTLKEAASNLDQCLNDFWANFSPKTDYLRIIINLFRSILSTNSKSPGPSDGDGGNQKSVSGSSNIESTPAKSQSKPNSDHLELFFLVVPALTINYIDHLINCKERASARSSAVRFGALLCDDGFAMGVAFLLTVLDQTGVYRRLGWLSETSSRMRADIDEIEERLRDPNYEESLKQTSSMTLRRMSKLHSEYVALDYTLICALQLFENFS